MQQEQQRAMVNQMVAKLTSACWDKCITGTPGSKFSSSESTCLTNCAQRYMDLTVLIMKRFQNMHWRSRAVYLLSQCLALNSSFAVSECLSCLITCLTVKDGSSGPCKLQFFELSRSKSSLFIIICESVICKRELVCWVMKFVLHKICDEGWKWLISSMHCTSWCKLISIVSQTFENGLHRYIIVNLC